MRKLLLLLIPFLIGATYHKIDKNKLIIDNSNVGIGTLTPTARLDVNSGVAARIRGGMYVGGVTAPAIWDTSDRLVSYYKFEENAANTSVVDLISAINGTSTTNTQNLHTASGKLSNAFDFDGTEYIDVTGDARHKIAGDFTFSCWVQASGVSRRIAGNRANTGTNVGWRLNTDASGFVRLIVDTGASNGDITGTTAVNTGAWFWVVAKRVGSTITIKVNNVQEASGTIAGDAGTGAGALYIANVPHTAGGLTNFDGIIDDVRYYSGATTDAEDTLIYNAGVGTINYANDALTNMIGDSTVTTANFTASDDDLLIEDDLQVNGTLYGDGSGLTGVIAASSTWTDGGTNVYLTTTSDNVGIGTTQPTGKLDIIGDEMRVWTAAGSNANALSSGELYVEGDLEVDGTVYGARQVVGGQHTSNQTSTFACGLNGICGTGNLQTWPMAGTLKNFYMSLGTAPAAGKSWVCTVRKNNADTALTCTIADANTQCSDTSNSVTVAVGDEMDVRCVASGSPTGTTAIAFSAVFIAN